jgi:hypothetical protein
VDVQKRKVALLHELSQALIDTWKVELSEQSDKNSFLI